MSILSPTLNIAPCALEALFSVIVDVYALKLNLKHRGQILKVFHDNNLFLFTLIVIQQRYILEASTQNNSSPFKMRFFYVLSERFKERTIGHAPTILIVIMLLVLYGRSLPTIFEHPS